MDELHTKILRYVSMICATPSLRWHLKNDHLYEGRFTPRVNGKRISKNVYAKKREECEEKLAELIKTMKAEIAEMKKAANA